MSTKMKYVLFSFLGLLLLLFGFLKFGNSGWLGMAGLDDGGLHWDKKSGQLKAISNPILDHKRWDNLLKKYVLDDGDVDYKGFLKEKVKLDRYLGYLSENPPQKSWSIEEQLAYYINTYNANTIMLILNNYPVKSIKDIDRPWTKARIKIGDEMISLGGIENSILRKMNEQRIHFAINCASFSCPKLLNEAYTAVNLEKQLQKVTTGFINSEKNESSKDHLKISKIFDWYKKDFLNGDLITYINKYSNVKVDLDAKVSFMDYDWRLNEQ